MKTLSTVSGMLNVMAAIFIDNDYVKDLQNNIC
jgi:hypothetical protein